MLTPQKVDDSTVNKSSLTTTYFEDLSQILLRV